MGLCLKTQTFPEITYVTSLSCAPLKYKLPAGYSCQPACLVQAHIISKSKLAFWDILFRFFSLSPSTTAESKQRAELHKKCIQTVHHVCSGPSPPPGRRDRRRWRRQSRSGNYRMRKNDGAWLTECLLQSRTAVVLGTGCEWLGWAAWSKTGFCTIFKASIKPDFGEAKTGIFI